MFNEILKLTTKQAKTNLDNVNEISGIYSAFPIGPLGTIREENSMVEKLDKHNVSGVYQKEMNKLQLLTNINKNTKKQGISFNDIPQDIIIKNMLFFLDINSLPKFSMTNRKTNEAVKTHIFIRLFFLNKEKKLIEQENSDMISSIDEKRNEFFDEYEIDAPNKEHACQLINTITNDDIMELKQCFKKFNKNYEPIVSPLVLLLGQKVYTYI